MRRRLDFPRVEIAGRDEWRRWLERHHAQAESIWLVTWKKGRGPHVPYADVVEEALCFGWVDSLPRRLDDARTMLLLSPRRPGSAWSRVNRERVAKLLAAGQMAPAGLAKLEAAKLDGSWSRLETVDALTVPDDLAAAFRSAGGKAAANFAAFPPSVRRGILEWIAQAKRRETRARRVHETATRAAANERANQWRERDAGVRAGSAGSGRRAARGTAARGT